MFLTGLCWERNKRLLMAHKSIDPTYTMEIHLIWMISLILGNRQTSFRKRSGHKLTAPFLLTPPLAAMEKKHQNIVISISQMASVTLTKCIIMVKINLSFLDENKMKSYNYHYSHRIDGSWTYTRVKLLRNIKSKKYHIAQKVLNCGQNTTMTIKLKYLT